MTCFFMSMHCYKTNGSPKLHKCISKHWEKELCFFHIRYGGNKYIHTHYETKKRNHPKQREATFKTGRKALKQNAQLLPFYYPARERTL